VNNNTRECLKEFIEKVTDMAFNLGALIGPDPAREVMEAGAALQKQLDKDETILP
jgi:hypothetical protein